MGYTTQSVVSFLAILKIMLAILPANFPAITISYCDLRHWTFKKFLGDGLHEWRDLESCWSSSLPQIWTQSSRHWWAIICEPIQYVFDCSIFCKNCMNQWANFAETGDNIWWCRWWQLMNWTWISPRCWGETIRTLRPQTRFSHGSRSQRRGPSSPTWSSPLRELTMLSLKLISILSQMVPVKLPKNIQSNVKIQTSPTKKSLDDNVWQRLWPQMTGKWQVLVQNNHLAITTNVSQADDKGGLTEVSQSNFPGNIIQFFVKHRFAAFSKHHLWPFTKANF